MAFVIRKQKAMYQGSRCCVPKCSNRQGTDKLQGVRRSYYRFPQGEANRDLRRLWETSVRRDNWTASKHDRVCSDHFAGGIRTHIKGSPGYIPSIFAWTKASKSRPSRTSEQAGTVTPVSWCKDSWSPAPETPGGLTERKIALAKQREEKQAAQAKENTTRVWKEHGHDYPETCRAKPSVYDEELAALHETVQRLEEENSADVDFERETRALYSYTALYNASMLGHVDVVRLLLRKGASVAKRVKTSFAPLHAAASEGRTEVVDLLVQHGATVDILDSMKWTPLVDAFGNNHVDTVRRLLELGARPDFLFYHRWARKACPESLKLIEEARKTKLLRCCNPKCGKPGYRKTGTLKLCAGCKLTRYCSRDCQIQHWTVGHKKCCGHDVCSDEGTDPFQKVQSHSTCICHTYDIMERLIAAFTKNL
ncbi:poly [ADP-ribose] polymerase tankyrase-2-like [Branchiostoma floridae]|uniref:Poly [ADP-ribose] polymerase tankyrase-2-like n=1 Tax=Branchiostoma floridae TaxID=7739 RepID=A0A9J7KBW0_BRAFL|nr:poly [ADP-ribose] polymerase tankyrase-2-like [Branchiostoma floridae]